MEISAHFSTLKVKRGEMLVRAGNRMRRLYFVNKGCLHTFHIDDQGNEVTTDFAFEGFFNALTPEFLLKKKGDYHIQAIEKSELLAITASSFETLATKYYGFSQCIFYLYYQRRNEVFQHTKLHKSVETYKWLVEYRPQIIGRISDKLIASYLGISRRTLIRAKAAIKM